MPTRDAERRVVELTNAVPEAMEPLQQRIAALEVCTALCACKNMWDASMIWCVCKNMWHARMMLCVFTQHHTTNDVVCFQELLY